uniref:Uncharacterized protein n=1 Tax=Anguilla anguilla TaxID=7936 RepID=A0A0E9VDJ7_ANGAN
MCPCPKLEVVAVMGWVTVLRHPTFCRNPMLKLSDLKWGDKYIFALDFNKILCCYYYFFFLCLSDQWCVNFFDAL